MTECFYSISYILLIKTLNFFENPRGNPPPPLPPKKKANISRALSSYSALISAN
jgi:hypothetical protein